MKLFFVLIFLSFFPDWLLAQPTLKHDLHFEQLATKWDEAIPLGNGMVGALVWQKGERLRFSLDRSDLWDERPMKGLHRPEFRYRWVHEQVKKGDYKIVQNYFDAPYDREAAPTKITGGALEFDSKSWGEVASVHLYLDKALCEVKWKSGVVLKTFVHAQQPIGWFRIENLKQSFKPFLSVPKYQRDSSLADSTVPVNDVSRLGYEQGTIKEGRNSISFHQPGWGGFSYEINVRWKNIDANTIEGVWSISSHWKDAKTKNASASVFTASALSQSYAAGYATHINWWKNFWNKSSIHIPDTLLEKQWYRDQYKFGATARKGAPPILLQGVWTADNGRLPPWKGDYHHDLNTEMSYWPAYSGNHLEEAMAFPDHLDGNKKNYKRYTKLFFESAGVAVPGVTTLNGTEMGGWIQYALSPTVSAWLAHHYYLQWRYSMDHLFLKNRAYPWFKEVAKHLEGISYLDANGQRQLPLSSSPEINNNNINAWFLQTTNYDLSLMKFVFAKGAEMAKALGLKNELSYWKKNAAQLGSYALSANNEMMYAPGYPYQESHRHFSHSMAIHPLSLINWEDGEKSQTIIRNTIALLDKIGPENWNGYSYSWLANLKARAKDGEGAVKALEIFAKAFCSINSFHVNGDQTKSGYSKRTYRPFTLEGNFAFAAALQEMLLQSHTGIIDIFPAIPASWKDVSFQQLRAEGAFLISAEKKDGTMKKLKIVAEKGGLAKIKVPADKYRVVAASNVKVLGKKAGLIQLVFQQGGQAELVFE